MAVVPMASAIGLNGTGGSASASAMLTMAGSVGHDDRVPGAMGGVTMRRSLATWLAVVCAAIASLAGVVAAIGVFDRGDGSVVQVTSERGVAYDMATTGIYANNAERLVAEGVGWDVFTLLVAVPALFVGAWLLHKGSFRGMLFTLGVLGYLLYQYLEYAVTWAFGPLFLPFVTLYGMSLVAILGIVALVAREGVSERFSADFPRRSWAALSITMSLLLTVLWLARIKVGLDGDLAAAGLTSETTLTVQALDLGLVVPLMLLSAALAWQRSAVGYAAVTSLSVTLVCMAGAIVGMLVSAAIVEGVVEVVPIAIFGVAGALGLAIGVRAYRSVLPHTASRQTVATRSIAGAGA